jgi:hypothetical protein
MPDASDWRERAATLRTAAGATADRVTRLSLLVLAEDCEALAQETEASSGDARDAHPRELPRS